MKNYNSSIVTGTPSVLILRERCFLSLRTKVHMRRNSSELGRRWPSTMEELRLSSKKLQSVSSKPCSLRSLSLAFLNILSPGLERKEETLSERAAGSAFYLSTRWYFFRIEVSSFIIFSYRIIFSFSVSFEKFTLEWAEMRENARSRAAFSSSSNMSSSLMNLLGWCAWVFSLMADLRLFRGEPEISLLSLLGESSLSEVRILFSLFFSMVSIIILLTSF